MKTRGKDLVGGEPQSLVLCIGHDSGGTEVDVFSQGLSREDVGNRNVRIMDNGVFEGTRGIRTSPNQKRRAWGRGGNCLFIDMMGEIFKAR